MCILEYYAACTLLEPINPRALRHTVATHCLQAKPDLQLACISKPKNHNQTFLFNRPHQSTFVA